MSEPAAMVVVPGEAGDFGVLVNHAPVLSSIRPGIVEIRSENGEVKKIFVAGGFADVTAEQCSVLAEEAVNVSDLDRIALEEQLRHQNEYLQVHDIDPVKKAHLLQDIVITKAKLAAVGV